ncbi:MAG: hypothetical protein QM758_13405 [Armatimonas sp.]
MQRVTHRSTLPRKTVLTVLFALLLLVAGCGGGGSSDNNDEENNGGEGTRVTVQNDLRFVLGKPIGAYTASSTPQTVRMSVNGAERTISNVVVVNDIPDWATDEVSVLLEGSKVLNITIPDPSRGVSFPGESIRAPISNTGVLQASILIRSLGGILTTPIAKWEGFDLPGGLTVNWGGELDVEQEYHVSFAASPIFGTGTTTDFDRTGTGTLAYSSNTNKVATSVILQGGNSASETCLLAVNQLSSPQLVLPSPSGTLSVPWSTSRFGNVTSLTSAQVIILFQN